MELMLDAHLITDRGLARERNEDRCGAFTPQDEQTRLTRGRLFIVADGMGGHAGGDIAAERTLAVLPQSYFQSEWAGAAENLRAAFVAANAAIARQAAEEPARHGMGAAAVAAAVISYRAVLGHLGDCRAYRVRDCQAQRLTEDHSWVEERVRAGRITADEARVHPYRNVLTRALGAEGEAEPTVGEVDFQPGDTLVLCSDGLWGLVTDAEIAAAVCTGADAKTVARALVDQALERGGTDNISIAVVRAVRVASSASDGRSLTATTQPLVPPTLPVGVRQPTEEIPRTPPVELPAGGR
jgi:protein phosphatase